MAQAIIFDSGVKEYQVNGGEMLRMNPSDPNLYARFFDAQEKLLAIEKELVEQGKTIPQASESATKQELAKAGEMTVRLLTNADRRAKDVLAWVFPGNDFDHILAGVNVMAVGANGERVLTNFVNALIPIIEEGVNACTKEKTTAAVTAAQGNRAQRRAAAKTR